MRVRSGDGGGSNSALRWWPDGRVPGRCGDRVRARASRRNGPGWREPRQAGHGCGLSRRPGRGCDALRGVAGRNRGGGMGRFRRLAASCAGLIVLAALAVAAPARAQDTTLVTNTSNSTNSATETDEFEYAQGFGTGSHAAGYTVTEIDIKFDSQSSTVPPTVTLVKGVNRRGILTPYRG